MVLVGWGVALAVAPAALAVPVGAALLVPAALLATAGAASSIVMGPPAASNLMLPVEAAGATMADIVKLNTYIVAHVDPAEVPKMRAIRNRYVNTEKPPASTLVVVTRLAQPGWLIEVEAVATIDT